VFKTLPAKSIRAYIRFRCFRMNVMNAMVHTEPTSEEPLDCVQQPPVPIEQASRRWKTVQN
jgi:hypothetical protein